MNVSAPIDTSPPLFKSLTALRMAHTNLLKEYQKYDDDEGENKLPESFIKEVGLFLQRAGSSGVMLDVDEDRSDAQALLNYWTTVLYNASQTPRPTVLAKFQEEVASRQVGERCPYRGLQAFHQEDRSFFYGRRQLAREMMKWLQKENFLAVVGLSGSGKSSVVRAGVVPELQEGALPDSESWIYHDTIVPGPEPLRSLAELTRPADVAAEQWHQQHAKEFLQNDEHLLQLMSGRGKTALVVVDQFEELFTLSKDEHERRAFVANLVQLTKGRDLRHIVIITMRSEFDTYVARFPDLQELFEHAQIRVPPLNPLDLRKAIEKPAERTGLNFEAGLVEELVQQVLGEPAGLPLLQFTLYKLWEKRQGKDITWAIYRELGGSPREVLAGVADATYESFNITEDRNISRRIMLRLVRPGAGLDVTSNRVRRASLHPVGARDNVNRVLDVWVAAGLLRVTPATMREDDQVEVMHEALIRNWPKLVAWVEEERVNMRQRLQLTSAAQQWAEHRRDPGGLLGGTLLAEALRFDDLNELEEEFVTTSQLAAKNAEKEKAAAVEREREQLLELASAQGERANQQAKAARNFRWVAATLAVLLIVGVTGTVITFALYNTANKERNEAEAQSQKAEKLRREAVTLKNDADELRVKAEDQRRIAEDKADQVAAALKVAELAKKRAEEETLKTTEANRKLQLAAQRERLLREERQKAEKATQDAQRDADEARSQSLRVYERKQATDEIAVSLRKRGQVRPGASVGSRDRTGSICCIVRDTSGEKYLLSFRFVFYGGRGAPILQPGEMDGGDESAKVAVVEKEGADEYKSGAIAKILPGINYSLEVAGIGRLNGVAISVSPGDIVRLLGRGSGLLEGKVISINEAGEILTTLVPCCGDSGGPVFTPNGQLIGMLWGSGAKHSVVTPIKRILEELKVELVR